MEQSGEVGKRGLEIFDPYDFSPDWKLIAESDSRFTMSCFIALARQRGEPLMACLKLDYEYEHEHEREFVIRASSFPNLCSLLPSARRLGLRSGASSSC